MQAALRGIRLTKKASDELAKVLGVRSPQAPVFGKDKSGRPIPDPELRETEQIPLTETVDAFLQREVLPYASDSFVPDPIGKIGYEVSFNRFFYKPAPLRSVAEIVADIRELDADCNAILNDLIGKE